ncbi:hypothetical protein [Streptomyces halobius]|uniref:Uncharacterized protein n=1 Tax=Streptomyces halobius TaxID=2879846 RepID=A0ABY4M5G3_9ACTN|nr:hypothetical protein [Streptomyces halobius]UQA92069.1 hypothetical protein K9S39_09615 [Streptomyces halobius]
MPHQTDASNTPESAEPGTPAPVSVPPATARTAASGGRRLTAGVAMLATAVAVTSLLVGTLLTAVSLTGHVFGAWPSPESLTPGLIGAAMLGTAPGLFAVRRAGRWEEARTLLHPLAIALVGLFTVGLLNVGRLYVAEGGTVLSVLFSLGWLFVLGLLCVWAVISLALQHLVPAEPLNAPAVPLPSWSKPPMAVLGSAWLGIGTGLLIRPGFWADFVPWNTNRLDAQALGVWALALGVGVLGALAEDDLTRTRPALLALPGTAAAMTVVLACRAAHVDWTSGPALSLVFMVTGLLCAGGSGRVLLSRSSAPHN